MINKTSSLSFNGLIIKGVIPAKNMNNFGKFATAEENKEFIDYLEKNFNTDMVMNGEFDEISFSHKEFGNLTNFGCPKFSVTDFYSKVVEATDGIKQAIKKAKSTYKSHSQDCEKIQRGC